MSADPAPRGATPHSDRPNWHPATTAEDYLRNCSEGLEEYSDRRLAKLTGWPRITIHRAKLMAELSEELFELLLAAGVLSSKALANVALAFRREDPFSGDVEKCPHCHRVIRVRRHVNKSVRDAINAWIRGSAMTDSADLRRSEAP